jgi:gas vesicle protein
MSNRARILFYGAFIGAVTGLIAASLLNRRSDKENDSNAITTGEGLKLGVMIFGLLRAIASLGEDDKK